MKTNEIKTLALLNSCFLWIYGKDNFVINERDYPDYELKYTTPYTDSYKAKAHEINSKFKYFITQARSRAKMLLEQHGKDAEKFNYEFQISEIYLMQLDGGFEVPMFVLSGVSGYRLAIKNDLPTVKSNYYQFVLEADELKVRSWMELNNPKLFNCASLGDVSRLAQSIPKLKNKVKR